MSSITLPLSVPGRCSPEIGFIPSANSRSTGCQEHAKAQAYREARHGRRKRDDDLLRQESCNAERAAARERKCPSPENDFRIVIRLERFVDHVQLHVEAASCAIEEATHGEQSILGAAGHQVEGGCLPNTTALCGARSHSTPSCSVGNRMPRP